MIIKNARIYTSDYSFREGNLVIRNGRIADPGSVPLPGEEIIDGTGLYALPGLVDIHFHGAAGHDFCDGDAKGLQAIAEYEARHGVLAICPATMTMPEETLSAAMDNAAAFRYSQERRNAGGSNASESPAADLVGIHLEGPFISPKKPGAQDPLYVLPADEAMFRRLQARSGGLIKICDVAPEEPGNLDFIREMQDRVRISLAHTCTDYETASEAFLLGAKQLTHLYNAMPGISHRAPGPVIAALEQGADVELIADGVHIHPAMVRFTFRTFGPEHVILISDSMEAAGLSDGEYELGGLSVTVSERRAVLNAHPDTIAGSVTNLYDCMRTAVSEMGIPLEWAVRAASENPARAIGIYPDYGTLQPGAFGNVILSKEDLTPVMILNKGQRIL